MVYLNLKKQFFKEITLKVDIKENTELELESTFSFNVNYNEDNTSCVACLKQELHCRSVPEAFNIVVESLGQFSCEGIDSEDEKKQAHVQAYAMLFPYVQSKIASLTKDAGGDPIMIEMARINPENVVLTK